MASPLATDFTLRAGRLLSERAGERDKPDGERSMARCVESFNSMTGHNLSEEDGWQFMVFLKFARMQGGAYKSDDYEDAVAYSALMAESAVPNTVRYVQGKAVIDSLSNKGLKRDEAPEGVTWSDKYGRYVGSEDYDILGIKAGEST